MNNASERLKKHLNSQMRRLRIWTLTFTYSRILKTANGNTPVASFEMRKKLVFKAVNYLTTHVALQNRKGRTESESLKANHVLGLLRRQRWFYTALFYSYLDLSYAT